MATGVEDDAAASLLDDVVQGSVNFKGSPASRSKSGCWKSASFIIGIEVAERFAYFGISSNLFSYLTGQLGQSTATAAENVNAWNGTSMLLPLLGAFVADSFLGRYWTICVASVVYILGLGLLSLSAAFLLSNSSKCKNDANNLPCSPRSLEVLLFISLYLVAFAQGSHKPCVQAFGADQFDEEDEQSSFFNWWNFSMNGGILAAILVLSYIQESLSWELGFGIPCIGMFFTLVVFLLGSRTYRFRVNRDERNPFMRIGRVFVKAAKNWNVAPELIYVEREERGILPHDGTKFKIALELGLGFLTLSSALNSFKSSGCKTVANNTPCSPSKLHTIFFFFSLYTIALAQGGHKPCVQAFGADQFDVKNRKECEAKSSYFNWFFWFSCFGIVLALSVVPYIQENLSWELGFAIPSFTLFFALVVFWIGTITYRFNMNVVECPQRVLEECPQVDWIEDEKSSRVGESRAILRLAPIWSASLGYSIIYAQPSTLFTKQAFTLDRHITSNFQIPAASLQLCISLSIMFFVSMYDFVLVPVARSITKSPSGISKIQRIGVGLVLSLISIVFAAVVERKRLATAHEHGLVDDPTVMIPMSVWWLAPQNFLTGMSDVFGMVGLQELFYDQVPSKLKSVGLALYLSILGVGSLMSSFLISFIQNVTSRNGKEGWFSNNLNRAHLDYFYWVLAGFSAFSFAAYVYIAKSFVYSKKFTV